MSIELKQAAQQALLALEKSQPHPSNPVIGLTKQDFIDHEETIRQLSTAIQQAEAQQPATSEPVVDVRCEGCGYMTHHREHMGCVRAAKQYTNPAPSVPDDVMRDAERCRFILAAADDMTTSRYKSLCELLGVAITEDFDLGAAIDAAMLAAKDAP